MRGPRYGQLSDEQRRALFGENPLRTPFLATRRLPSTSSEEALLRSRGEGALQLNSVDAPELSPEAEVGNYLNPPSAPIRDELRYSSFINNPLAITNASVRILLKPPITSRRVYLFIANTSAAGILYVNFGNAATALNGIPILPNFGFLEYNFVIPQDDIYIVASVAGPVAGIMTYSNDNISGLQVGQ